jgi:2-aminoadipate transaminase
MTASRSVAWSSRFARRTHSTGGGELTAILALADAGDVITFSGGFPAPETFPTEAVGELAARLLRDDAAVTLQYAATPGISSVRAYLRDRVEEQQGRRPRPDELMISSGGIDAMELVAKSLLDPGDAVVTESPSYLGGLMAFRSYEAVVHGVPVDDDGMRTALLADLFASGVRPKLLYTIPEYQNPTGVTLSLERRHELVELCRRYEVLVLEDVAYRELGFDGETLPSLWSLAPDVVVQAGTFSKTFFPGVRLGWAAGPAPVVDQLVVAKQNSDQCAGALGQRLLEEYGRSGRLDQQLHRSRALYARRWEAMDAALVRHLPSGCRWTRPRGGFFTWLTCPEGIDTVALRPAAAAARVAYVPGAPFHPGAGPSDAAPTNTMRLSFSRVADDLIDEGVRRLAGLLCPANGPDGRGVATG